MEIPVQELISLKDPLNWKKKLESIPHSFGHTWDSCHAMFLTTGFPTYLYTYQSADGIIVCPIIEREFHGTIDIATPYGFSGFAGNSKDQNFHAYWLDFMKNRNYVCAYIGMNPLLDEQNFYSEKEQFVFNNIYLLDLGLSKEELYKNLSDNRKRQIKTFKQSGQNILADKKRLSTFFQENYHGFMARKFASDVYNFSETTLKAITDSDNTILFGIEDAGQITAVAIFAFTQLSGEYLFYLDTPDAKNYSVILIWMGIEWMKDHGIKYLNLGGGVSANDSVAEFKRRFGATEYPLKSIRQVFNLECYERLCIEAGISPAATNYFPAYRTKN